MTERLYYDDAYLTAFDATLAELAEGGRRVYLDRTAFYPTSGGQPFDTGTLAGVAVVDVVDDGERVAHVLAAPLASDAAAPGTPVQGVVDWIRRFDHMQQHTGQHVLSAVFSDLFGRATVSVHFGATRSTLDLDVEAIGDDEVRNAEARANAIVQEARPVHVRYEDAGSTEGLRKATDRGGLLRIVEIAGVDRSACGGTHVRSTSEIGPILLRRQEQVRRTARLEFLCGRRALGRARSDFEALAAIARSLSCSQDDAPAIVQATAEQLKEAERSRRSLADELISLRARALYDGAQPDATGLRRLLFRDEDTDVEQLRALASAAARLPRVVFAGVAGDPPTVVLAASEDSGIDAAAVLRQELSRIGGRGGGSARLAQARIDDHESARELLGRMIG